MPTHFQPIKSALSAAIAAAIAGTPIARAQSEVSPRGAADAPIEEIVVRGIARKFRPDDQTSATGLNMSLLETPLSVSVITPEMLDTINADGAFDATDLVPNVQRGGYGYGTESIVLRGLFLSNQRINGILVQKQALSLESYALERMEVVRGPATVIYGVTGSLGGEINNILKRPSRTGQFDTLVEVGNFDTRTVAFDVAGPLTREGALSGRLVAKYDEYDLPVDIPGVSLPNYKTSVLGALAWDLSDSTTLRVTHYYQHRNIDPYDGGALIQNPDGTLSIPTVDPDQWYFSHPDQSKSTNDVNVGIIELDHDFDNGFRSVSKLAWDAFDEDRYYYYPFGPFGAYALADDEVYLYNFEVEWSSEALIFSQSLGSDFELFGKTNQFLAALEYTNTIDPLRYELLNSAFQGYGSIDMYADDIFDGQPRFSDGTPFVPIAGDRESILGIRQVKFDDSEDLKLSLQVQLKPTDNLQILAGVLYHDNDTVTTIPRHNSTDQDPPLVTEARFSEVVYRFGASYGLVNNPDGFASDARIYYSFSEGFEPQTLTHVNGDTVNVPQKMEQHELGLKAELLGGAVGASIALFDYEITNVVVYNTDLGAFGSFGNQAIEGTQEATGLELELVGELLPGWNVVANYGYMDAAINNLTNNSSTPPRNAAEHSGTIMTTYEFLRGALEGLRVGATFKASGEYSFIEGTSNVERYGTPPQAGAHQRFDLNGSYAPRSGLLQGFNLYFNWQNVFDEPVVYASAGHPGFGVMFIDQPKFVVGLRYTME